MEFFSQQLFRWCLVWLEVKKQWREIPDCLYGWPAAVPPFLACILLSAAQNHAHSWERGSLDHFYASSCLPSVFRTAYFPEMTLTKRGLNTLPLGVSAKTLESPYAPQGHMFLTNFGICSLAKPPGLLWAQLCLAQGSIKLLFVMASMRNEMVISHYHHTGHVS